MKPHPCPFPFALGTHAPSHRIALSQVRRSKHTHSHSHTPTHNHHHNHTPPHTHARVRADLRNLLRNTAQPVAVVTSLMPVWDPTHASHPSSPSTPTDDSIHSKFHGATLSSFSSIAMDPHPLIAFSLRIPSRMATTLKHATASPSHSPSSSSSSSPQQRQQQHPPPHTTSSTSTSPQTTNPLSSLPTHLVINILSSTPSQTHLATLFSRPDLHPHPFSTVPYHLTPEGLPVLDGALGALSCRLVAASWPLHDLESLRLGGGGGREGGGEGRGEGKRWEGEGVASELFIGRVVRVEDVRGGGGGRKRVGEDSNENEEGARTPLLYYQRRYTTIQDLPPHPPAKERS